MSVSVSMASVFAEPKVSDDRTPVEVASIDQDSMPVEVASIDQDSMPVEVASIDQVVPGSNSNSNGSVEPSQRAADQSMTIVVAAAAPPAPMSEQVDIAPTPPAPQQVPGSPPVAPAPETAAVYLHPPGPTQQHVTVPPPPAVARPHALHGAMHQRVIPYHEPAARPQAPAGDNHSGFSCKECYRWFPTHQGLGGHVAGHKNKRIAAAAAAAIAAGINPSDHAAGGPRQERLHTCKFCGAVYTSGLSLGGHMRKHYKGKPIVPRKRLCLLFPADLGLALQMPPPTMEARVVAPPVAAQPPRTSGVQAGSLRIFGVTIVQHEKEKEEPPVDDKE
ncbi:hypothetical protein D1007_31011 [Hordeum vulgare]|nr:hypothetical protein D1007_31011 [Hordeum vulgare]